MTVALQLMNSFWTDFTVETVDQQWMNSAIIVCHCIPIVTRCWAIVKAPCAPPVPSGSFTLELEIYSVESVCPKRVLHYTKICCAKILGEVLIDVGW